LQLEINGHIERIDTVVMYLNSMDMFLGYDWLVKHNPDINWNIGTIQFTRCLKECKIQHQDIVFISRTQRLQSIEDTNKVQQEIGKELDLINLKDLLEYIWLFTYLFNKKKFKKLPE